MNMIDLFVLDAVTGEHIPADVRPASEGDLAMTQTWQTNWTTPFARNLPNKVALYLKENQELLALMSYALDPNSFSVEVIYLESAPHSNANLLHLSNRQKRYLGVAKALFAYAVHISLDAGFCGILVFRAKTSELLDYYRREFGARQIGAYDPFRLVIWEDAAERLIAEYRRDPHV